MTTPEGQLTPLTRSLIAGGLAAALVFAIIIGMVMSGGSDSPPTDVAGSTRSTSVPDADLTPRDVTGLTTDAATGQTTTAVSIPASAGSSPTGSTPAPTPLTWQQQIAANPTAPVRLNPLASDWTVEQVIIGKDMAGKFLVRINVRFSGPGSATGKFALTLLKDGREITTLTGTSEWVPAGTYPIIMTTDAAYVDGPWTSHFRVVSTS